MAEHWIGHGVCQCTVPAIQRSLLCDPGGHCGGSGLQPGAGVQRHKPERHSYHGSCESIVFLKDKQEEDASLSPENIIKKNVYRQVK